MLDKVKSHNAWGKILILSITIYTIYMVRCSSVEPPTGLTINLKLEDVSCTEAWITLNTTNLQRPTTLTLKQNSQVIKTINLSKSDSLVYIDSLLPNTSYQYQASSIQYQITSDQLQIITLDTTSHNFTWQTYTFGAQIGSCNLYDAAIIDENNIYAVGEIYLLDSLGQPIFCNAVHWDGNQWKPKKITVEFRGNMITPPLEGVFAFSSDDIWLVGSLPIHGDGTNWMMYDIRTTLDPNISLSKAWGTSSNDIYFVGKSGSVAYYDSTTWRKINSGTSININDIWGTVDNDGNKNILCAAYDFGSGGEKKLLSINGFLVNELEWIDNRELYTVWFNTKNKIYAGGEGLFNRVNNEWKEEELPAHFKFRVRGAGLSDIWTVGGYGFAAHYNGRNWRTYQEISLGGNYYGLAVKGNVVVLVGDEGASAVVSVGIRQ